jgi:L-ascorbate metabolism protein UlaG (beta-lactamase superfamily)
MQKMRSGMHRSRPGVEDAEDGCINSIVPLNEIPFPVVIHELLAQDADLLITECSHNLGESNPAWPRMTPQDAADIARQAGAKRLALTHFDAGRYTTIQERLDAAKSVRDFEGIIVTQDGMIFVP